MTKTHYYCTAKGRELAPLKVRSLFTVWLSAGIFSLSMLFCRPVLRRRHFLLLLSCRSLIAAPSPRRLAHTCNPIWDYLVQLKLADAEKFATLVTDVYTDILAGIKEL